MSSHRIDLLDKTAGPRRWPAILKEEIVLATLEAGATVASVGIYPRWAELLAYEEDRPAAGTYGAELYACQIQKKTEVEKG